MGKEFWITTKTIFPETLSQENSSKRRSSSSFEYSDKYSVWKSYIPKDLGQYLMLISNFKWSMKERFNLKEGEKAKLSSVTSLLHIPLC